MTGNGKRPAQEQKNEVKESFAGASDSGRTQKVHTEILDKLIGFAHATPGSFSESRVMDEMKLHLVLKSLLTKNGESARGAAKACKIPLSTFSSYLKPNKRQVDPSHLLAIARHYGVTVDYLFGYQPSIKLDKLPTKKLFSRWVKLTIEDIADDTELIELKKDSEK